ncbi:hypothetical protein PSPO01_05028 [Paraphaeosphaeria sporulosa]
MDSRKLGIPFLANRTAGRPYQPQLLAGSRSRDQTATSPQSTSTPMVHGSPTFFTAATTTRYAYDPGCPCSTHILRDGQTSARCLLVLRGSFELQHLPVGPDARTSSPLTNRRAYPLREPMHTLARVIAKRVFCDDHGVWRRVSGSLGVRLSGRLVHARSPRCVLVAQRVEDG